MQPKVEPGNRKVRLPFDLSIARVYKVPRISLAEVATLGRRLRRIVLRLDYELAIEVEQRTVGDRKMIRIFCVWHAARQIYGPMLHEMEQVQTARSLHAWRQAQSRRCTTGA
jgi:hypothetical protein